MGEGWEGGWWTAATLTPCSVMAFLNISPYTCNLTLSVIAYDECLLTYSHQKSEHELELLKFFSTDVQNWMYNELSSIFVAATQCPNSPKFVHDMKELREKHVHTLCRQFKLHKDDTW